MVIIFAVLFAGGGGSLFTGNIASSITDTPEPTETSTPTGTPTISPWDLKVTFLGCNVGGFPKAEILSTGSSNGYTKLLVERNGSLIEIASANFVSPKSKNVAALVNSDGFNTKPWKVELYSGGQQSGNTWTGGTLQKTYDGTATRC